jgi:aminoglycoside phosphotransferase (APT) family kinase protein
MTEREPVQDAPELTAVREAHRFDEAALAAYLRERLPGCDGPIEVRQFEGGQSNPTYQLAAGGRRYVLRKKPKGLLLPSAHQVEREYRVMTALHGSDVPVPRTRLLCEDPGVIGTPFYVMDHVDGRVLTDARMPRFSRAERTALYADFVRVLAALHSLDPAAVGLGDFGRPGNYYTRQIARWSQQYLASETEQIPAMQALMEWLPAHVPESDETRVVHGDYRIGNCIIHPSEPRVVAVLDWELSTLGHPLGDLAYFCQGYHGEAVPGESLAGVDLDALGIPSEAEVVARYCRLTGRERIDHWSFYLVFVMFRSAAIVQGVYKRGLDGNAASDRAKEYGALVRSRAEQALALAHG